MNLKTKIISGVVGIVIFSVGVMGVALIDKTSDSKEIMLGAEDTIAYSSVHFGEQFLTTFSELTYTATTTSGTGRYLVVGFAAQVGPITGCTYDGTAMTEINSLFKNDATYFEDGRMFGLANPTEGANNVVCTAGGNGYLVSAATFYTGVDTSNPIGATGSSTLESASSISVTLSTEEDNSWLVGYAYTNSVVGYSAGSNTTIRYAPANWHAIFDSNDPQTPTGSHALNLSASGSGKLRMMTVELKPTAATSTNNAPTITSVSDTPDPVTVGSSTTFSVDWNDNDTEGVKMFICKTDSIATATPSCPGGEWTSSSTVFSTTDPITASYTASSTDVGTNNYYAFVCDDEVSCSTSTSGTFTATSTEETVTGTVTLTEVTHKRVFQRGTDNEYDLTVSGAYTGNPTTIQARVVNASTTEEVVTWTAVDSSLSGGTFSGTLSNVPDGGWYNLQVRFGENTSIVDEGATQWGVGVLVGTYGQSNMAFWFYDGYGDTQTATSTLSFYNDNNAWYTTDTDTPAWGTHGLADGAIGFGNYLIENLGVPVGLLDFASPSAGIVSLKSGEASYTALSNGVTAVGGDLEYFLWIQGETDGDNNMAEATYEGHLETLISSVQTDFSRGGETLPFIMGVIGRRTSSVTSDTGWNNVRNADKDVASADSTVYIGSWNIDIPLVDGIHATPAGYVTVGQRMANAVLYLEGESSCYEGPYISSYEEIDNQTVDIRITHNCGTDFTPTTAITGFRLLDDASSETITSATQVDSTKIRLITSGTITGALSVDYQWGQQPVITGVVNDNSALTLPLVFSTEISEYVAPPTVIYPTAIYK